MADRQRVDAFDRLMERLDPPVLVVTAAVGGERAGCLVGFHAQSSIEPRGYAVWLSRPNHTFRVAIQATHLGIHFLGTDDRDLAELFGTRSGDDLDKFTRCDWAPSARGVPLLRRCPNRMEVHRTATLDDGGDHLCFVARPVEASLADDLEPLRLSDVADLEPGHEPDEHRGPEEGRGR